MVDVANRVFAVSSHSHAMIVTMMGVVVVVESEDKAGGGSKPPGGQHQRTHSDRYSSCDATGYLRVLAPSLSSKVHYGASVTFVMRGDGVAIDARRIRGRRQGDSASGRIRRSRLSEAGARGHDGAKSPRAGGSPPLASAFRVRDRLCMP